MKITKLDDKLNLIELEEEVKNCPKCGGELKTRIIKIDDEYNLRNELYCKCGYKTIE